VRLLSETVPRENRVVVEILDKTAFPDVIYATVFITLQDLDIAVKVIYPPEV
jgi:hypothetical protein